MAQLCGACFGLLAFSAMIVCGMFAGNPPEKIVLRAVVGLFAGFVLGVVAGWIGLCIVKDNAVDDQSDTPETPPEAVEVEEPIVG